MSHVRRGISREFHYSRRTRARRVSPFVRGQGWDVRADKKGAPRKRERGRKDRSVDIGASRFPRGDSRRDSLRLAITRAPLV